VGSEVLGWANVTIRAVEVTSLGRTKSLGGFLESGRTGFFCVVADVAPAPVLGAGPFAFAFDLVVLGAIASVAEQWVLYVLLMPKSRTAVVRS
jgi:hypothetical protein